MFVNELTSIASSVGILHLDIVQVLDEKQLIQKKVLQ